MTNYSSVDAVLKNFYDSLQFGVQEEPDYGRILACFHPGAIITPPITDTGRTLQALNGDEFTTLLKRLLSDAKARGGREYQVSVKNDIFGHVANAFSHYEFTVGDTVVSSGVNSFQLMNDGRRWWIMSLAWDRAPK